MKTISMVAGLLLLAACSISTDVNFSASSEPAYVPTGYDGSTEPADVVVPTGYDGNVPNIIGPGELCVGSDVCADGYHCGATQHCDIIIP